MPHSVVEGPPTIVHSATNTLYVPAGYAAVREQGVRKAFVLSADDVSFCAIVRSNHTAGVGVNIGACCIDTYIARAVARCRA